MMSENFFENQTTIRFDDKTLKAIDALVKACDDRWVNRSSFVRAAVQHFIREKKLLRLIPDEERIVIEGLI